MFTGGHIFLTGFMGSGKSLLGKKTAPLFGMDFIDLDTFIEHREEKKISQIFQQQGEAAFRKIETRCLEEVIGSSKEAMIALGGGTICFDNNLQRVKQAGLLVYIELSAGALADRLKKNRQQRPLLNEVPEQEVTQRIAALLNQRQNFYRQAHLIVNGLNLTPPLLYQKISEARENIS